MHSFSDYADCLTELMNIASGRAAAALSDLTQHHIVLRVPEVRPARMHDLSQELSRRLPGEVICVNVPFYGVLSGVATFAVDQESARRLVSLLDTPVVGALDARACDVLTEAGSVLLNACIGTFANVLSSPVKFGVPQLRLVRPGTPVPFGNEVSAIREGLWAETKFTLRQTTLSAFVALFAPASTIRLLANALGKQG
jgi:chemotaxis protein CheY-P-specific phosphatase CheC